MFQFFKSTASPIPSPHSLGDGRTLTVCEQNNPAAGLALPLIHVSYVDAGYDAPRQPAVSTGHALGPLVLGALVARTPEHAIYECTMGTKTAEAIFFPVGTREEVAIWEGEEAEEAEAPPRSSPPAPPTFTFGAFESGSEGESAEADQPRSAFEEVFGTHWVETPPQEATVAEMEELEELHSPPRFGEFGATQQSPVRAISGPASAHLTPIGRALRLELGEESEEEYEPYGSETQLPYGYAGGADVAPQYITVCERGSPPTAVRLGSMLQLRRTYNFLADSGAGAEVAPRVYGAYAYEQPDGTRGGVLIVERMAVTVTGYVDNLIRQRGPSRHDRSRVFAGVLVVMAEKLDAMHRAGVLHGNLHRDNFVLTPNDLGAGYRLRISRLFEACVAGHPEDTDIDPYLRACAPTRGEQGDAAAFLGIVFGLVDDFFRIRLGVDTVIPRTKTADTGYAAGDLIALHGQLRRASTARSPNRPARAMLIALKTFRDAQRAPGRAPRPLYERSTSAVALEWSD